MCGLVGRGQSQSLTEFETPPAGAPPRPFPAAGWHRGRWIWPSSSSTTASRWRRSTPTASTRAQAPLCSGGWTGRRGVGQTLGLGPAAALRVTLAWEHVQLGDARSTGQALVGGTSHGELTAAPKQAEPCCGIFRPKFGGEKEVFTSFLKNCRRLVPKNISFPAWLCGDGQTFFLHSAPQKGQRLSPAEFGLFACFRAPSGQPLGPPPMDPPKGGGSQPAPFPVQPAGGS